MLGTFKHGSVVVEIDDTRQCGQECADVDEYIGYKLDGHSGQYAEIAGENVHYQNEADRL